MHNAHPIFQDNKLVKFCALYTENYGTCTSIGLHGYDNGFIAKLSSCNIPTCNKPGNWYILEPMGILSNS